MLSSSAWQCRVLPSGTSYTQQRPVIIHGDDWQCLVMPGFTQRCWVAPSSVRRCLAVPGGTQLYRLYPAVPGTQL